jgi:lipopolysaccharide export system permease protein
VLLLLGLPFVMGNERRNVFLAVIICLIITCFFMVVTLACHWLGAVSLVAPSVAAWLPLMLFAPLACWLVHPVLR